MVELEQVEDQVLLTELLEVLVVVLQVVLEQLTLAVEVVLVQLIHTVVVLEDQELLF